MNTFIRKSRLIPVFLQAGLALGYLIWLPTLSGAADQALRQYKKGNYPEAIRTYDRILKDHSDWEEAHFGKGAALYKSQRTDEAMQEFEKALAVKDPVKKSAVFYNLGNSLYQSGRAEESLAFYKKALELNPRDYDAKYNYELARLMLQQQKSQQNKPDQKDQKQQDQQDKQKDQSQPDNQSQDQKQQQQQNQAQQQQAQKSRQEKEKSQKEAAQVLDALKNDEKQLMQERRQMKASGLTKEKDW